MTQPILVVMAVFRPSEDHLEQQMASIARQTGASPHLIAVIADTRSAPEVERAAEATGLPVTLVHCDTELDSVRAFEAGLIEAVDRADAAVAAGEPEPLIALSDQDDIWHDDRLLRGIEALSDGTAQMAHGDARLVDGDGSTVLHQSMFRFERRIKQPRLRGLLYRNNITGMTLLMRPRVARVALPFPRQAGVHYYHDLWLGLIAEATGGVRYVDRPLVDYRQHGGNVMGAIDRQSGWLKSRGGRKLPDMAWLRREAASYALARFLAQSVRNRLQDAEFDGRLPSGTAKTRGLKPYLRGTLGSETHVWDALTLALRGHLALARIAAGFAVVSAGRVGWTLQQALGPARDRAIDDFDRRLYSMSPGVSPEPAKSAEPKKLTAHNYEGQVDARKEPKWTPEFTADGPSLTVLVPTLNPSEIFAGIATAVDIGLGLAQRGIPVRFVATDLPVSSAAASRGFLLRRMKSGASSSAGAHISVHCGQTQETIPAHADDLYLATAWWTAHGAEKLIRRHGMTQPRFYYLIQDFEPNFYPWGPEFADACASYTFDFEPIFNTALLRDFFADQGFDFATPDSLAFRPSIDVTRYAEAPRTAGGEGPRRLALYGRPEVARNMYGTAVEALARFVTERNLGPADVKIVSIGLPHPPLSLPNGLTLESLGKLPWEDYPGYLAGSDLGLSLMYSPHPSHPPIEMAASGMRVVTNGFGPKDLSRLSKAILSAEPEARAIADALSRAWDMPPVTDDERRIDLATLGASMDETIDRLAANIAPLLRRDAA
jgi:hypothetical protein